MIISRVILAPIILISSILMILTKSQAQKDYKVLSLPERYNTPYMGMDYTDALNSKNSEEQIWIGIIPQYRVTSYREPELINPLTELKFRDYYYIAEIAQRAALLIKGDRSDVIRNDKIRKGQNYGWVNLDELILWSQALRDSSTNSYLKAIQKYDSTDYTYVRQFNLWQKPKNVDRYKITLSTEELQDYYYIAKKENDFYLLCRRPHINSLTADSEILGWAHASQLLLWNDKWVLKDTAHNEVNLHKIGNHSESIDTSTDWNQMLLHRDGNTTLAIINHPEIREPYRTIEYTLDSAAFQWNLLISGRQRDELLQIIESIDLRQTSEDDLKNILKYSPSLSSTDLNKLNLYSIIPSYLSINTVQKHILLKEIKEKPFSPKSQEYYSYLEDWKAKLQLQSFRPEDIIETKFIKWYYVPLNP